MSYRGGATPQPATNSMPYKNIEDQRKQSKRYYKANREKMYASQKKWIKAKSLDWYENYKTSLFCIRCGYSDARALEFHHRDPTQKIAEVSAMARGRISTSLDKLKLEINKCDVLCCNCHRIETWKQRKEKHGEATNRQISTNYASME